MGRDCHTILSERCCSTVANRRQRAAGAGNTRRCIAVHSTDTPRQLRDERAIGCLTLGPLRHATGIAWLECGTRNRAHLAVLASIPMRSSRRIVRLTNVAPRRRKLPPRVWPANARQLCFRLGSISPRRRSREISERFGFCSQRDPLQPDPIALLAFTIASMQLWLGRSPGSRKSDRTNPSIRPASSQSIGTADEGAVCENRP